MYGTLIRCHPLPGKEREIEALSHRQLEEEVIPGFVAEYALASEKTPGEVLVLAVFDSEERYRQNAASPEQHQRYLALRALLAEDPEWTDGAIVELRPATVRI
jgi:heme-degrading monooxygenase HmoA